MRPPLKKATSTKADSHDAPSRARQSTRLPFDSVTSSATYAPAAGDVSHNLSHHGEAHESSGISYRVGDVILARTGDKPAREATIVEIDPADGSRFKVAFKDKRKKSGWRRRDDLASLVPSDAKTLTGSRETNQNVALVGPRTDAGSSAGAVNGISVGVDNITVARLQIKQPSTARSTAAAAQAVKSIPGTIEEALSGARIPDHVQLGGKADRKAKRSFPAKEGYLRERKRTKGKAADAAAAVINTEGAAGNAVAIQSAASQQRPSAKRAVAAVEESAMTSMVHQARQSQETCNIDNGASRAGGVSSDSGVNTSRNSNQNGNGKSKLRSSSKPPTSKMPRTLREGWTRPKVVTPGSLAGRSEPALRTMHPWEVIRPRKAFKIQQPKTGLKPREDARASQTPASTFAGGSASSRPALRRPLCQPSHTLQEVMRGVAVNPRGAPTEGEADGDDEGNLRRGRRARRQVHPSLSEDKMAEVAFGDVESDNDASSEGENESPSDHRTGYGKEQGETSPPRFWKTAEPWGQGDIPRIKVTLNLQEDGTPLCTDRIAIAMVSFSADRHRYSGEQLANVLTAKRFLCYHKGDNRVFVLTNRKESEQKAALKHVRELALSRCGVRVETTPWLVDRPALDEFVDNHRRVLRHIVRHRLAIDTWSEVDGVYFKGLFRGRGPKRIFSGVRLGINLAVSSVADLETGVWDVWISVEPSVHRFSPVNWLSLLQEKEDKRLQDFSGSKSDNLERRLQVVCLPNCTRGVVYDVQEETFEMDRLQEANLKRGYVIGPRLEDEMVEYWRQVHHISLPSSFFFVKVRIGGMVLTYPSWCIIRKVKEIPEATKALRSRILNDFTDTVNAMEGITVKETTFTWHLAGGSDSSDGGCVDRIHGSSVSLPCFHTPAFTTASGRVIGERKESSHTVHEDGGDVPPQVLSRLPFGAPHDTNAITPSTPERIDQELRRGGERDEDTPTDVPCDSPNDIPNTSSRPVETSTEPAPSAAELSPGSKAARAAAQASLAAVRKSFVRRKGVAAPRRPSSGTPATSLSLAGERDGDGDGRESITRPLCSTPFMIKRAKASSGAGQSARQDAVSRSRTTAIAAASPGLSGNGSQSRLGAIPVGRTPNGASGGGVAGAGRTPKVEGTTEDGDGSAEVIASDPDTPHAPGSNAAPARFVTPAAGKKALPRREEGAAIKDDGRKREVGDGIPTGKFFEKGAKKKVSSDGRATGAGEGQKGRGDRSTCEDTPGPTPSTTTASGTPGGGGTVAAAPAAPVLPSPTTPSKIVVIFMEAGSLGMGLQDDETEEGSVVLMGVSPTSAAARVPTRWRITEVGGRNVRRLGTGRVASLLRERPLAVTFEPPQNEGLSETEDAKLKNAAKGQTSKQNKAAAPRKQRAASAKPKAVKSGKKGSKKSAKVTTVRKAFKVQSRGDPSGNGFPGDATRAPDTSTATILASVPLSSSSAVI